MSALDKTAVLTQALLRLGKFSENGIDEAIARFRLLNIPKGSLLLQAGETCKALYYVAYGSLRQFTDLQTGEQKTLDLFVESDWLLDYKSFTGQVPAKYNIEAYEDSELYELHVQDLHALMNLSPEFFQIAKVFQFALVQQEMKSSKISPGEKYEAVLKDRPLLLKKFPLKYIASYLDITPETLSRVRGKI